MTVLRASAPRTLSPDPGTARDWLQRELSRSDYQESLLQRVTGWFNDVLGRLLDATGNGGLSPLVAFALLTLLVGGIALALSRLRSNPAPPSSSAPVFAEARRTADQHRRLAQTALARESWDEAVLEAVRAMTSGLVERGLLPDQSDVTVHEIGEQAAAIFPSARRRLRAMTLAFDATRYGDRPADDQQARAVVDLEVELSERAPERPTSLARASAVPR